VPLDSELKAISHHLAKQTRLGVRAEFDETRLKLSADVAVRGIRPCVDGENVGGRGSHRRQQRCRQEKGSDDLVHRDREKGNKDFYILNLLVQIVNAICA